MTNSDTDKKIGTLWMAATTLGDMKDIPVRSLELLKTCPFLVFEEDKQARQFLKAAGVQRQWMRYTEQREAFTLEELERELRSGNDALYMSDQGTPGLADPGRDLVEVALRTGAKVRAVPGPSSLTATISVCPIDCKKFTFAGFPPRDELEREHFFRRSFEHPWPVAIFDTPYRMKQFFETLHKVLMGTGRKVFVGVDISGPGEDFWFGSIEQIVKKVNELPEKLNYVVIVEGNGHNLLNFKPRPSKPKDLSPNRHSGQSTRDSNQGKKRVQPKKYRK
jgi:16S rRNA (cytidine1402-2'-O)-methyltransferase